MKRFQSIGLLALALAFFGGGAFLPAAADAGEKPKRMAPAARKALVKAQEAVKRQEFSEARETLGAYLAANDDQAPADVYSLLGNTWYLEQQPDKACEAYRRGLARYPENASLHQNFAVASYMNENYAQAGDAFVKAFELADEKPDRALLFKAGAAYYNGEKFELARQSLNRLLAGAEEIQLQWRQLLVYTHFSLKDWDAAESTLRPLLDAEPASAEYWKLLARLHVNRDNHREAAATLDIAYQLKAPDPSGWGELADLYLYLNAPLRAAKCIKRGFGENPGLEEHEKLALAYARALRYDKAISEMDKAIEKEPTAKRYKMKATFYYKDRRFQKALASFEKVLRHAPEDKWAHLMMGFCAMSLDNYELAHKAFSEAARSETYGSWAKSALAMVDDLIEAREDARRGGNPIELSMR